MKIGELIKDFLVIFIVTLLSKTRFRNVLKNKLP